MDFEEIRSVVIESLSAFVSCGDLGLLLINASERAIAHRFACHLTDAFKGWDIDCEYNRDGPYLVKRLYGLQEEIARRNQERLQSGNPEPDSIYPDIIVHHRIQRLREHNLLVVEAKKSTNKESRTPDESKLVLMTQDSGRPKHNYNYQVGLFVEFTAWKKPPQKGTVYATCVWFENGKESKKEQLKIKEFGI